MLVGVILVNHATKRLTREGHKITALVGRALRSLDYHRRPGYERDYTALHEEDAYLWAEPMLVGVRPTQIVHLAERGDEG